MLWYSLSSRMLRYAVHAGLPAQPISCSCVSLTLSEGLCSWGACSKTGELMLKNIFKMGLNRKEITNKVGKNIINQPSLSQKIITMTAKSSVKPIRILGENCKCSRNAAELILYFFWASSLNSIFSKNLGFLKTRKPSISKVMQSQTGIVTRSGVLKKWFSWLKIKRNRANLPTPSQKFVVTRQLVLKLRNSGCVKAISSLPQWLTLAQKDKLGNLFFRETHWNHCVGNSKACS